MKPAFYVVRRSYKDPRFSDLTRNHDLVEAPDAETAIAKARTWAAPFETVTVSGMIWRDPYGGPNLTHYF